MAYPTGSGRTIFPGPIAPGDSVGATNNNGLGGGQATYAQITTTSSALGTGLQSISGLSVSVSPTTARTFLIVIQAGFFTLGGTGTVTTDFLIYNNTGAAGIASIVVCNAAAVGVNIPGATVMAYHQPGAGTTNYIAALQNTAGSGSPTVAVGASGSGSAPRTASIQVFDVGPAY